MNKVLIFPSTTVVADEIVDSLKNLKDIDLHYASSVTKNVKKSSYFHHVPSIDEEGWIKTLIGIIKKHDIGFIFPTHVFVIDALARHREEIPAKVLMSSNEVIRHTRSKKKAYETLKGLIPIPRHYLSAGEVADYPVFLKPDNGYGQQHCKKVTEKCQLEREIKKDPKCMVQEYLPGEEYTVDCLSDKNGKLLFCAGRERAKIRIGTSMTCKGVSQELNLFFNEIAEKILMKIGLYGAWFFQMKRDSSGELKLLEVEPRIAGTMGYHRNQGINFSLLTLYIHMDVKSLATMNNHAHVILNRSLKNTFETDIKFNRIYIDLDDTIITKNTINLDAISIIYKAINNKKRITLISKSLASDKEKFLEEHRISQLFNEKIWLTEEQSKADFIEPEGSIFIDDSFSQRLEVSSKLGIPTFDLSMVDIVLSSLDN